MSPKEDTRLLNSLKVHRAMRDWTQAELAERIEVVDGSFEDIPAPD